MKKILSFLLISLVLIAFKGDKPAYVIYDIKGKISDYENLLKSAREADIVLFGELHDNPICHWLELELTKDLYSAKKEKLVLGAEMFEADDQIPLNEYLAGRVSEKTMKDEIKLWTNFHTDYKPLLDFAKDNHLNFVAANIPRRYANMVYNKGMQQLDSLDTEAKKWICPLPMDYDGNLKCYKEIYEAAGGHGGENLPKSQAIKDATMAYFIMKNWSKGKTLLHYNGSYHSNYHQGIEWYLKKINPSLKIFTIGSTEQAGIDTLAKETTGLADYIICTPESMTKTQ
ncbi:MAG: ChaN family lipoprotein [Bacteroidia bacterium]